MSPVNRDKLDEFLSAYLDDELTEAERAEIESLLEADDSARHRLETLRGTVDLISALPRRSAPPSLMDDVMSRLERDELLEDLNATRPRRGWQHPWLSLLASAALVTICVGGAWYIFQAPTRHGGLSGTPVAVRTPPATPTPEKALPSPDSPLLERALEADRPAAAAKGPAAADMSEAIAIETRTLDAPSGERGRASVIESRNAKTMGRLEAAAREEKAGLDKIASARQSGPQEIARPSRAKSDKDAGGQRAVDSLGYARSRPEPAAESRIQGVPASSVAPSEPIAEPTLADAVADVWQRGLSEWRRLSDDARDTIDEKLADGAWPTDLARHHFGSEMAQVQVAFATEADRQAAARRLARFLEARAVPEVRQTAFLNFLGLAPTLGRTSPFFILGQPTVNFADPREQQILVRVEPQQVQPLLDAVLASADAGQDVSARGGASSAREGVAGVDLLTLGLPVLEEGAIAPSRAMPTDQPRKAPPDGEAEGEAASVVQGEVVEEREDASRADAREYDADGVRAKESRRPPSVRKGESVVESTASPEDRVPSSPEGVSSRVDTHHRADGVFDETMDTAEAPVEGGEAKERGPSFAPALDATAAGPTQLVTVVIRLLPPGQPHAQPVVRPETPAIHRSSPHPTTRPAPHDVRRAGSSGRAPDR